MKKRSIELRSEIAARQAELVAIKGQLTEALLGGESATDPKVLKKLRRRIDELNDSIEELEGVYGRARELEDEDRRHLRVATMESAMRAAIAELVKLEELAPRVQNTLATLGAQLVEWETVKERVMVCARIAAQNSRTHSAELILNEARTDGIAEPFVRTLETIGLGRVGIDCARGLGFESLLELRPSGPAISLADAVAAHRPANRTLRGSRGAIKRKKGNANV